ncbi:unnamed protein product [Paramecium primaurelia]|uniref:non-specific serine/threonine protein kinase n=1 Tax=Paramecium primaurelia TaxID=5886 RepID=A0A8S1QDW6_PARPR|nr:unnamed protein product [Paramecium primaurelia]
MQTLNDYEIIEKLGSGSYGDVMLARQKENGQLVAIKTLEKRLLIKEKKQYQVFIEKEVLTQVKHPGLINLIASFQSSSQIYLVLEFVEGGDFANFLKINKNISQQNIVFYSAEIVSILEQLHSHGIAHRDVKPENIMVANNLHIKMIDFGTANFFDERGLPESVRDKLNELREVSQQDERFMDEIDQYQQKHKATFVGTAEYVSPELLEDDVCGPQADLWALGCIIYKMFTGITPFCDQTEYLVFQKVRACQYQKNNKIPQEAIDLISKLLVRDPLSRLGGGLPNSKNTYRELKSHPFFKEINWDQLWSRKGPDDVQIHLKKQSQKQELQLKKQSSALKPEVILTGLVNKKTGWMIYKLRNMILYDYEIPKLEYFDPNTGMKKGQIILDKNVIIELLKGQFNIDVPNKKKYYFKECEHPAQLWVDKIKDIMKKRLNYE